MPTEHYDGKMSSVKEKGKKAARKTRDGDASSGSEFGESIDTLSEVEVKMRLEAMDNFGKWYVAKVLEVDEDSGEVLVHFDRWSSRYDEYIQIGAGRLRKLTQNRLKELQKEKDPVYVEGDRVQAKWEDGKMYFGNVTKVNEDSVDVLFDDGVEYTAPLRSVRKRRVERTSDHSSESLQSSSVECLAGIEARRSRAMKRSRNDDSASQSSMSSPPSSPAAPSWSKRPCRRIDSDSTETESDFEELQKQPLLDECPLKPKATATSDGKQPPKRGRPGKHTLREPYKLRKVARLEPLKEDEVKASNDNMEKSGVGLGALLTPPSGDIAPTKPDVKPPSVPAPAPPHGDKSPKQIPNPTPPETPQTDSNSDSGILKRMLSHEDTPTAAVDHHKKISQSSTTSDPPSSPSKNKPPVSSRTRAQTKFENITKRIDKKDSKKQTKAAPKELVIVWDHNQFKCTFTGCNKSFRKESLLQSHIKHYHTKEMKLPRLPHKLRGVAGKSAQSPKSPQSQSSPLSPPSGFSLSPHSPHSPHSQDDAKSPKGRKSKNIIISPPPRRNPSRSKITEVENREKSPTESFFEVMEKEKKSNEMMQLLEQSTKEQKSTSTPHKQTAHASTKSADKGTTSSHHHSNQSKGTASSSGKPLGGSSKKLKQTTLRVSSQAIMSVAGPPQRGSAVEIRTLSRDSLSHSSAIVKTAIDVASTAAAGSSSAVSKNAQEHQHNTSDSVEEMDTSNEFEAGEMFPSNANEVASDEDVVHCICGSIEDEGFMIQCEQCLCWQHGDCVGITEETLPEKYICYICDNPPGLRKRYQYQFDQEWYADGSLPSLPGAPEFSQAESMKKTHLLAGQLYKLRKMMHSSKVKLQAASTVNHPYLKQWAKECAHRSKDDIMQYIMRSLLPVSYPKQPASTDQDEKKTETTDSKENEETAERTDSATSAFSEDVAVLEPAAFTSHNGTGASPKVKGGESTSSPIDVSSLHLDPLPRSTPPPQLPQTRPLYDTAAEGDNPPDPKSLQLAPLPPLAAEDQPTAASEPQTDVPVAKREEGEGEKDLNSHKAKAAATTSLEVFSDEFGIQEMSVFATTTGQPPKQQQPTASEHTNRQAEPSSGKLISSSRSAFRPVVIKGRENSAPTATNQSSQSTTTSASARDSSFTCNNVAGSAAAMAESSSKVKSSGGIAVPALKGLPSMSKSKSGMDSVTLGEFSEAFVKGDTTNWFQRMLLLDHIETVQDKIRTWMEIIDQQLDSMPEEDSQLDDMETLLKNVQSSIEQLGQLQQQAAAPISCS